MSSFRGLPLAVVVILALILPAQANNLPNEIAYNLRQIDGIIVMPIDGEYLIDLDASKGIAEGDIFSVIIPGKPVVHPVTGKIIGSLDKVEGWLEVTRIKNGYSYARSLNPSVKFTKKTQISRFSNLPAVFWDYSGDGENIFANLRTTLPQLKWSTYVADQQHRPASPDSAPKDNPTLFFIYKNNQLQIRGLNSRLIGQYTLSPTPDKTTPAIQEKTIASSGSIVSLPTTANSPIVKTQSTKTTAAIIRNQSDNSDDLWTSSKLEGNPTGIEINDFDSDGKNEIAILHKNTLEIGQFTDRQYQQLTKLTLEGIDKALTISSADLDGDGRPELFISAIDGLDVSSLVVAYKDEQYKIIQKNLPWFLRALQNVNGSKLVLGQRLGDKINTFDQHIVKISFTNGNYVSAGAYPHPWQTNIFSLQPVNDANGNTGYTEISSNDHLRFFSATFDELWESSESYGGSMVSFPREDSTGGSDYAETFIYIKPRLALLDSTTILAPLNEGWRISKSFQSIGPGQVTALKWDGSSMVELWHTKPQPGSLADFQYADIDNDQQPEVVLLFHFKRSGLLSKGRSGLRIFEINN